MNVKAVQGSPRMPRRRWTICALLFCATTVNYIDRQTLSILKPILSKEFSWTETDYADIVFWFQIAYIVGMLVSGRLIDRFGTRVAFAGSIALWSVSAVLHAAVSTVAGFSIVRFFLGLGESANMPASVRAMTDWFPKRERAFAIGIFNAGTNAGAMVTPIIVPLLVITLGWRWAFVVTGFMGVMLLLFWLKLYQTPEKHPKLSREELAYIRSDPDELPAKRVALGSLLQTRQLWAIAATRFCTDPVWPFLLFWLPDYLNKRYELDIVNYGPPLFIIFLMADVGSIGGGWLSSKLIQSGMAANGARRITLALCAICATPAMFLTQIDNMYLAVAVIALLAATHQAWGVTLWATVTDVFPREAVGSAIAITSSIAGVGALIMITFVGRLLEAGDGYSTIFMLVGFAYLFGFGVFSLALPKITRVSLDQEVT
jgi:MFS transporter, ACS family, hexuronate transporter